MPFRFGYHTSGVSGSVTMTGGEVTVFEATTFRMVEGYVDLTPMQAGDAVTLKQYVRISVGGAYVLHGSVPYINAQTIPLTWITPLPGVFGVKLTATQTAGVNRTFSYAYFQENRH